MSLRENDICHWHWLLGRQPIVGCYGHLAVFSNGGLRDTFWYDWKVRSPIELDRIEFKLLGNIDECREIKKWEVPYYDPADIINMSHSNNSNAPIYLKLTASKSQAWMLARAEEAFAKAQQAKSSAERDIADLQDKLKKIKAGDLEVYL